ncbi:saccharopine dehydrogenase NADP-binding domain-containing protein [Kribbella sp. NPDC051586]|uniref:saccharopine dehydrogenase NADP-binding domain-containing protein n=1 Tax=Kribbella sp. NPDC051586 TaxID=3364118 RepID=UPI0037AF84DD
MIAVYGATGHTGRLVAAELAARGAEVVLAGRDAGGLEQVAAGLGAGVQVRVADLDDDRALRAVATGAAVVINCAGPFARSGGPVARAAIATGAHYLDHAAEPLHVKDLFDRFDSPAGRAKVLVSPGMSFYGAIADLLAAAVAQRQGPLDSVTVAYAVNGWRMTPASKSTAVQLSSSERPTYDDGAFRLVSGGAAPVTFDFPAPIGARPMLANYPAGEVVTIPRHLSTRSVRILMTAETFQEETVFTSETIAAADRGGSAFTIVVQATAGDETRTGYLRGNDIYRVGALTSMQAALALADRPVHTGGVRSAAQLFEPLEFLRELATLGAFTDTRPQPIAGTAGRSPDESSRDHQTNQLKESR